MCKERNKKAEDTFLLLTFSCGTKGKNRSARIESHKGGKLTWANIVEAPRGEGVHFIHFSKSEKGLKVRSQRRRVLRTKSSS